VVTDLPVSVLVEATGGQARHVDEDRVRKYAQALDELPPVVVFDTEAGLLLVDGYHRLAAAVSLGRASIPADVRSGTRHEALAFAIGRATADRGMTAEPARAGIERWSVRGSVPPPT
jgi:hypothetical protein